MSVWINCRILSFTALDEITNVIKNRSMHVSEFKIAQSYIRNKPIIDSREDLEKYLEAVVAVKGHAWCMDMKSERRKMAKLIISALSVT